MTQENLDKLDLLLLYPISKAEKDRDLNLFDDIVISDVAFDRKYFKRRNNIIRRQIILPIIKETKKVLSRVAVFLLILFSVTFITIMSVSALRNAIWKAVVEWYDDYFAVHFEEKMPTDEETDAQSTNVGKQKPCYLEKIYKPTAIDVDAEEDVVMQNDNMLLVDYYLGDDWLFTYRQNILDDMEFHIDRVHATITKVDIGGNEAQLFQYDDNIDKVLIWNNGEYIFTLTGSDIDLLIENAKSIRPHGDN